MPKDIVNNERVDSFRIAKYCEFYLVSTNHFLHFAIHEDDLHTTVLIHENVMNFYLLLKRLLLEFPVYF